MSWSHQRMPAHTQLLPLPDDGIALSNHPAGWLGVRWRSLLDKAPKDRQDRILRGRNYARRGRLRGLQVSPGAATAEVHCEQVCHPTLRVRTFSRNEWATIVDALTAQLDLIASLLEGELPSELVERLDAAGIHLLPRRAELTWDCDCGDFVMPCTHVSTVFHVLTDALDGDPFLLLTLRGRDRSSVLAMLRQAWGDPTPLVDAVEELEEAPPDVDWFTAPGGVPDLACHWGDEALPGAGLRALGPPPGEGDLLATLLPLYEAGHARVREVLDAVPDRPPRRIPRPVRPPAPQASTPPPSAPARSEAAPPPPAPAPPPAAALAPIDGGLEGVPELTAASVASLTERLVAALDDTSGSTSAELARRLGVTVSDVRAELVDLLALGLVYQRKQGRFMRWFLG